MRTGRRAARLSWRALQAHPVRTALALVSVGVGTAGVLSTSAVGAGASAQVRQGIETAGGNLLVVRPAQTARSAARRSLRGVVTSLRPGDARAIAAIRGAREVAPGVDGVARVKAGAGSTTASVTGTVPSLARLRNLQVARGRFLDETDDLEARRVAVLGARVAETLFPGGDGVGRDVRLRGLPFEVVGVLRAKGVEPDGSDQDGNVFIPLRTALRRVFNTTWLSAVFVSVPERAGMRPVETAVRALLRERHRLAPGAPDDFEVQDQVRTLALQQEAVRGLTLVTAGLAAVAMLVGGTGILALQFLSVKERTAEIGLRMAVGARPRDVLAQFLGEATLLALGGWVVGALFAAVGAAALRAATGWPVAFPGEAALGTLALALVAGAGGGAVPARRASRVAPVRALGSA
ncbi:MAG: ABC transporter permease [Vicinamibacteria bacterium]